MAKIIYAGVNGSMLASVVSGSLLRDTTPLLAPAIKMKTRQEIIADKIAEGSHLIVDGRLRRGIWDTLTVQCGKGFRCVLVCSYPCRLARKLINRSVPVWFQDYARWN